MKQTAVEKLIEQIKNKVNNITTNTKENRLVKGIYVDCLIMAKQAKEMEKEQIINAVNSQRQLGWDEKGQQYYEETFKNK